MIAVAQNEDISMDQTVNLPLSEFDAFIIAWHSPEDRPDIDAVVAEELSKRDAVEVMQRLKTANTVRITCVSKSKLRDCL